MMYLYLSLIAYLHVCVGTNVPYVFVLWSKGPHFSATFLCHKPHVSSVACMYVGCFYILLYVYVCMVPYKTTLIPFTVIPNPNMGDDPVIISQ